LIQEKGFSIIAVEADWPDAYRVNRYVRTNISSSDQNSDQALSGFKSRFPVWMWRNTVVKDFVDWMKEYNTKVNNSANEIGFYGLDVYSMNASRDAVIEYLETVDPELAAKAKKSYGCFDRFSRDTDTYSYKVGMGLASDCEDSVIKVLNQMLQHQAELMESDDTIEDDRYFYAKQNAKVVKNAENYYRNMIGGDNTWNIRDGHMLETLVDLLKYYSDKTGKQRKAIVWAHNSHIGAANQTQVSDEGEVNIGQLCREEFGLNKTFNVGFTTYTGTVTASSKWNGDPEFKKVNEGLAGSFEKLFHESLSQMNNTDRFMLLFRSAVQNAKLATSTLINQLSRDRLERAIGVIYAPRTERYSHYFNCKISKQFDAIIHIDKTSALHPLELHPKWNAEMKKHAPLAFPGLKDPSKIAEQRGQSTQDFVNLKNVIQ
jgi:erythromycin esterase-like protein